ncbi:hypothetical protein TCAL_13251 [Tigriopus californicus]|uniref:Peptidase S1 domain-containing protein n=1 Tax=Tigriopus californicus TaxID=6832 RepID=A0A553P8G2_TIGCA|nr:hypothetical protein TCAL_13251 [Tigriopus californicus]
MHSQLLVLSGLLFGLVLIHLAHGVDILVEECSSVNGLNDLGPGDRFVIRSHNFSQPGGYDGPQRCTHIFRKQRKCPAITIGCDRFELEPANSNGECKRDFLNFKGTGLSSFVNNERHCGAIGFLGLTTPSKRLRVLFKTNRKNNDFDGFQCFVSCADNEPSTTEAPLTTTSTPVSCQCGVPNRQNRIVGGQDTEVNEYPWQVYVATTNPSNPEQAATCGGTLISDRFVLSAAHCFPSSFIDLAIHPRYNTLTLDNDFAVIELDRPILFDTVSNIRPVCLPTLGSELPTGTDVTATGWGATSFQGQGADVLQEVTIPTVDSASCQQSLSTDIPGLVITNNMLCAGLAAGGKDSCQGDSGGPLVSNHFTGSYYEVHGVTSFGVGCANANRPGVYAKVSAALNWILGLTGTPTCERPSN